MPKEGEIAPILATSTDKFGRPSKLTQQVIELAWQYLEDTTSIAVNAGGLLPTKERLALTLNVSRNTMHEWAKQNADFQDILDTLDKMQADMLLQNGLTNRYNPTIAKLLLSKHGYIEKTEQKQNISVVQPILNGKSVKDVHRDNSDKQAIEAESED